MPDFNDIQKKSGQGIKWVGFIELFTRIIQYITTIVLARLLTPEDFGVIGIALVFTQLAMVLFDFGFSSALIQKKELRRGHLTTAFSLYLLLIVFYALAFYLAAPFVAAFFEIAVLESVLVWLIAMLFFYAFSALPSVLLQRDMRFKQLSLAQFSSAVVYAAVAMAAAFSGFGVWSFVYAIISEQLALSVILIVLSGWRPAIGFDRAAFDDVFSFGSHVMGTRIVAFINAQAPSFVIGKMLGATALGYYQIAYQLIDFPVQRISKNVLRVMFPAFSKLQDKKEEFVLLYKRVTYYLNLILMPLFLLLALTARDLVPLLYGPAWLDAIVPLQILCVAGFARSLWTTASVIFLSQGRPGLEFKINLGFSIVLIPALIFAATLSLDWVALALSLCVAMFLLLALYRSWRIVGLTIRSMWPQYATAVYSSLLLAVALAAFQMFFLNFAPLINVIITICGALIVYVLVLYIFDRKIIKQAVQFVGMR